MNFDNFTFGLVRFEGLTFCFALGSNSVQFILSLIRFSVQKTEPYTGTCDTYFLDLNTKEWTRGPNITRCRHYHSCNLIRNDTSGNREVVVVGGWDKEEYAIREVEIIDLDTLQVRNGE